MKKTAIFVTLLLILLVGATSVYGKNNSKKVERGASIDLANLDIPATISNIAFAEEDLPEDFLACMEKVEQAHEKYEDEYDAINAKFEEFFGSDNSMLGVLEQLSEADQKLLDDLNKEQRALDEKSGLALIQEECLNYLPESFIGGSMVLGGSQFGVAPGLVFADEDLPEDFRACMEKVDHLYEKHQDEYDALFAKFDDLFSSEDIIFGEVIQMGEQDLDIFTVLEDEQRALDGKTGIAQLQEECFNYLPHPPISE